MVYYRMYRPQTIAELDSEKLRETLYAVLSTKSIPHAFLFTGPKGLGKTSTARIVAKVVNCENNSKDQRPATNDQIEPCNKCDQCISITNGTNIDILEIDGASNRGIDEIRELRERVHLAPSSAKKKVYIIDEVHMLTTEAFNALLKTIEEPPSHAMFIFCTTEPHKVPATIVSRCFHITFHLATVNEIVHSLRRIVKGEKIDIDEDVLELIAQMSEGGFRDAAKILEEQVALSKGKRITKDFFEKTYKTAYTFSLVQNLLEKLHESDIKEGLQIVKDIVNQGIDIKFFVYQVLTQLHGMLLGTLGVEKQPTVRTKAFTVEQIKNLIELFSKAYQDTKFAVIAQLPLEMAVIQYASSKSGESEKEDIDGENKSKNNKDKHTMDSLMHKQQVMKVKSILNGTSLKSEKKIDETTEVKQHDISSTTDSITTLFENIIYKVKPYNHSVAGVLRGSKIKEVTAKEIIFTTAYKFHKEKLEEKKTCEIIEKAIKEITGKNLQVMVQLIKK